MNDTEKVIELKFRREDFQDIYFRNKQGSIFKNAEIKSSYSICLIFLIIFCISLCISILKNTFIIVTIFAFLALLSASIVYFIKARHIWKWRSSVNTSISKLSEIRDSKITLTQNTICICYDALEIIEKWALFTKVTINEDYVLLLGGENHLFPRKSMAESDFKYLKDFVARKIKEDQ